jgi:diguanylate cyclase (GGDEF)-like protein
MDTNAVLLEFLDCLNASTTVEGLLDQTALFFSRTFRPEHCALWVNGSNASSLPASRPFLEISNALHRHVQLMNTLALVQNPAQDVLTSQLKGAKELKVQVCAFPIRLQGQHVATLVLGGQGLSSQSQIVSLLLDKLSVALGRAQQLQSAQHSAVTDSLTQLYNKAYFLEALKNEVARSERTQRPISLVLFDFDDFKQYNDTNGHVEGDKLLARLGSIVRENIRSIDIPARYGGEEFVIILPETAHDKAFGFAERLRQIVAEQCAITISIGIATCLNGSLGPESLLKEADKALYTAKRNGKNQTRNYLIIDKALGVIDVQDASSLGKKA